MSSDEEEGDESRKSYQTILAQEIEEGLNELRRPKSGLFLSGLSAGLDVGFGPLLMAVALSHTTGDLPELLRSLIVSSAYAVGFLFVILGRSDLFTEHTVLAILPVMDGRASVGNLLSVWATIYVGNLVGCVAFALIAYLVGPAIDIVEPGVFGEIANILVLYSWWAALLSAVFAGWLMGLLSWLVVAARETISIIVVIWIVAGAIGFAHLPHSIAGTVEVLFGVLAAPDITLSDYAEFLLLSTVGNVVGGVIFVALLKYSHVVRGGPEGQDVEV